MQVDFSVIFLTGIMSLLLLLLIGILITIWWYKKTSKPTKFPPGPPRYPLVGSMLQIKNPWKNNKSWPPSLFAGVLQFSKQYGDVFGFYMGDTRAVVLTDLQDIKYVFNLEEAHGRPAAAPQHKLRPGWQEILETDPEVNKDRQPGVITTNGNFWREQRRFLLKNLRDFGFGKNSMEDSLNEEVSKLMEYLKPSIGKPVNLNLTLNISILNALWAILVGEKLSLDDPKPRRIIQLINGFLRTGQVAVAANLAPFPDMLLWPVINKIVGINQIKQVFTSLNNLVVPILDQHKESLDEDNIRDFVDLHLAQVKNTSDPSSSFYGRRGELALQNNIMDLFLAGMETTSSSILWSILFILHHPQCQDKLHLEIDSVVGPNRLASFEDRPNMHYMNAFLLESFRTACFLPMSIFQWSLDDIQLGDFIIPKDTILISSLYHILYNPDYFPEPEKFKPERFLDASGRFVNDERVVNFGIGKRSCLGRSLAEKEYFLFMTGLLQTFKFKQVPGTILPRYGIGDVYVPTLTRNVPLFDVILELRE